MSGLKYFIYLCTKSFSDKLTRKEKDKLNRWIRKSDNYFKIYEDLKTAWNQSELEPAPVIEIDEEWHNLDKMIDNYETSHSISKIKKSKNKVLPLLRPVFGTLLILILLGSVVYKYQLNKYAIIEKETQNQQKDMLVLSDGSEITLNSASSIEYKKHFAKNSRDIVLVGEAYFKVQKDGRPFQVHTPNALVTVLGTEFNVWARDNITQVIVKKGKVMVFSQIDSSSIILVHDQMATVELNNDLTINDVDSKLLVGWVENRFYFDQENLTHIVQELERSFNVKISIADSNLSYEAMTIALPDSPIDTVLSSICLALDSKFVKVKENHYSIISD